MTSALPKVPWGVRTRSRGLEGSLGLVTVHTRKPSPLLVCLPPCPLGEGVLWEPGEAGCGKVPGSLVLHSGGEGGEGEGRGGGEGAGGGSGTEGGARGPARVSHGFPLWFGSTPKAWLPVPVPLSLREAEKRHLCGDPKPGVISKKETPQPKRIQQGPFSLGTPVVLPK